MGTTVSQVASAVNCGCFEEVVESAAGIERLEHLKKGATFIRKIMMGISTQKLFLQLSPTSDRVAWRVEGASSWVPGSGEEYGEIDLLEACIAAKPHGEKGLNFSGKDGKSILTVDAEDIATRDAWVVGLTGLFEGWRIDPSLKPRSFASARGTSDKTQYFEDREKALKEKQKERQARKEELMKGSGMKFTAQAMANRV